MMAGKDQASLGEIIGDARQLAQQIREAAALSRTEEDLRVRVEAILADYLRRIGIYYEPQYELFIGPAGRLDVLYGALTTEYKRPGLLRHPAEFSRAIVQVQNYLEEIAKGRGEAPARYVGVILDGEHIGFVRQRGEEWIHQGPLPVDRSSVLLWLEYLRGLSRQPLDPDLLVRDFGPQSEVARHCIQALWGALEDLASKPLMLFREWQRLFSQVSGYEAHQLSALNRWASQYDITPGDDPARFLFAVHTYYALLIKLLTAEVLSLLRDGAIRSYVAYLALVPESELRGEFQELESGGVFRALQIENLLEGDFFAWYLEQWNPQLDQALRILVSNLQRYEPATIVLEPERVRDLLKYLYQYLVPKTLRHDLGEYYTPDWLAEFVLDRVGYKGIPGQRLLDPGCGSGTFLVLAIQRAKEACSQAGLSPAETVEIILRDIVGFDLNPLAVIAARANYIMALGELLNARAGSIEIPIYLCDSIFTPRPRERLYGQVYEYTVQTGMGDLSVEIPASIVEAGQLGPVMTIIEEAVAHRYNADECLERISRLLGLDEAHSEEIAWPIQQTFAHIQELEQKGWDRIWCRVIKNSYAPATVGKFDFVVGNPSWVRWTRLPSGYVKEVKNFCQEYGLFSSDRWVGGIENDISMLLTYSALNNWVRDGHRLGFVITQTVFKSESAEGFRRFCLPDGTPLRVLEVHDMVDLRPFEGAYNRTAVLFLEKGHPTAYPVKYVRWRKKTRRGIDPSLSLAQVLNITEREELVAEPVYRPGGPWLTASPQALESIKTILGRAEYQARKGVTTDLNGVYWLEVIGPASGGLLHVRNRHDIGRKKVRPFEGHLEADLLYPLVRGRDIGPFSWMWQGLYVLVPQKEMRGFDEAILKRECPRTYAYFDRYRDSLLNRSSYRRYHRAARAAFYSLWNVGPYTFAPYKVAWREVQHRFEAAVIGSVNTPWQGRRVAVLDHKLYFVPCELEDEAHYLCAVLNSALVRRAVEAYAVQTQVGVHVMEYVRIPRYDAHEAIHQTLAMISKDMHALPTQARRRRLEDERFQQELDKLVKRAIEHAGG